MKLQVGIILVILQTTTALSTTTPRDDGPAAADGETPPARNLFAQSCWTKSPYGCSDNRWCWKQCGSNGEWCWLARNWGKGEWKSCSSASDCVPGRDNSDCGQGNCEACGCSC